jgi:hypothetical protein
MAPNNETGKTATETVVRRDLRNNVILLAWTENDFLS